MTWHSRETCLYLENGPRGRTLGMYIWICVKTSGSCFQCLFKQLCWISNVKDSVCMSEDASFKSELLENLDTHINLYHKYCVNIMVILGVLRDRAQLHWFNSPTVIPNWQKEETEIWYSFCSWIHVHLATYTLSPKLRSKGYPTKQLIYYETKTIFTEDELNFSRT